MQDRGINSTFKKIIYESSEMVFLADDTFPYSIFYANESFENQIGETLKEKTLAGLGLDINAYIFKEELILTHGGKDYSFRIELPHENGSNYFLFFKGKEVRTHGLPNKEDSQQFFKSNLDLIAIGQHDYLTYLNGAVLPILGYEERELLNTNLCNFIHNEDIVKISSIWKNNVDKESNVFLQTRVKTKHGEFKTLECSVQFTPDRFFIIARDISEKVKANEIQDRIEELIFNSPNDVKTGRWDFDQESRKLKLSPVIANLLNCAPILDFSKLEENQALVQFRSQWFEGFKKNGSKQEEVSFSIELEGDEKHFLKIKGIGIGKNQFSGVLWDEYPLRNRKKQISILEGLFQKFPEPGMIVYPDGNIFMVNSEAKKLFGLEKEVVNHLRELGVLFDNEELWKDWIQYGDTEAHIQRFSSLLISAEGKQLTLEVSSQSTSIEDQEFVILVFRNITEKVRLEKTIEESSDFLMNLTEQVPGGLYQMVLDLEGKMKFSFLSKGISTVLGLNAEEIDEFTDISTAITRVHPMDLPQVIMSSVASARKQEPWQCQFRVRTEVENEFRWVLGAARPQLLPNGDMVWYGYLTDISKQKEFESKLDKARKTAEKASQIKSDFLSMISHELRTPLNAISGSVYSLLQEQPNGSQKTELNTINFAVDNLIIMINDLLDFQKIEAGKLTIEKNPFNFENLINQIIKGLSFHARDSKNKLNINLSEGLDLWVQSDKTRLSQILNNLITNALKFTNEGNVNVTVNLKELKSKKARIYFEVKDSGIGIAKENQEKIFNDFDQVKPSFSTKYGGTGLGLSITRKLLNLMGGTIQLESEVGIGSRFYFELEFDLADEKHSIKMPAINNLSEPTKLKLLMAEDNDVNALVLGKIIKKWGFYYDRVLNGEEAIKAAKENLYDCILMDIQMPVMDGFDATMAIKTFSKSPVIALTAASKLEIMEKLDQCGFDGFVAKPIDAAELFKKINEMVLGESYSA
jgi:PAS domain S-box-containing protein